MTVRRRLAATCNTVPTAGVRETTPAKRDCHSLQNRVSRSVVLETQHTLDDCSESIMTKGFKSLGFRREGLTTGWRKAHIKPTNVPGYIGLEA